MLRLRCDQAKLTPKGTKLQLGTRLLEAERREGPHPKFMSQKISNCNSQKTKQNLFIQSRKRAHVDTESSEEDRGERRDASSELSSSEVDINV